MNRIFAMQSALRITVKTFCNLEDIKNSVIKFRKPDGEEGELSAAVADAEKGEIIHEFIEGELDIAGWWVFWAFITFGDGRTAAGEAAKVYVWREGC